jgi:hypothetical protein
MVELDAYAADCRLYGNIEIGVGRMSDQFNETTDLHVLNARVEDLADGHVVALPELQVERDELCAVVVGGPRGDVERRLTTKTTPVEVDIGPYRILGMVHGPRGGDPFGAVLRRGAWVPLTEANVMYVRGGQEIRDRVPVLLVNRHLMRTFREFFPGG